MKLKIHDLLAGLGLLLGHAAFAGEAVTVTVDCNRGLHAFERDLAFGINVLGEWDDARLYPDNIRRFQQLGVRLVRYPGGTNANEHHWNGAGHYDSDQIWHDNGSPHVTTFAPGFYNLSTHRGSTVVGNRRPAKLTDGDSASYWLSYPGDENPQWVYLDLSTPAGRPVPVNRIVIEWAGAYATRFKLQYSNADPDNGRGVYAYNDSAWTDLSTGELRGHGGRQDVAFDRVSARFIRVLCLAASNAQNQYGIREVRLYNDDTLLTCNRDDGDQTVTVSSSVALGDVPDVPEEMNFEQFLAFLRSVGPDMVPLIDVNFCTGTPQEAADWVYYANVFRGCKIKYWEVGNENWGNWEAGGPVGSAAYAERFLAFHDAMTAVDPDIVVIPQFCNATDPEDLTMDPVTLKPANRRYYIDHFLAALECRHRSDVIQALSVHSYPGFMPVSEAMVLAKVDEWDGVLPLVRSWIERHCPHPAAVKIFDTEYNDSTDSGFTNHFYNALFVSGYILDFLRDGGDCGCFFTSFGTPKPGQFDKTIAADFGMLEGGALPGARKYQPRSSFHALTMLHNDFSADDALGNTLVAAVSSAPTLKVYANRRGDNRLSLILINTDPAHACEVAVTLTGFKPRPVAGTVSYSPANYVWIAQGRSSHADPDNPPDVGTFEHAASKFTVKLAPYALKIVTLDDAMPPPSTSRATPAARWSAPPVTAHP